MQENSEKSNNSLNEKSLKDSKGKSKHTNLTKNIIRKSLKFIDDTLKNKTKFDKEELFKICLPSFLKNAKQRNTKDTTLISLYLGQMEKFMKIFGDDLTSKKIIDYHEQLKKISSTIMYEKFNRNRIIVKFGDEGKKFFLILNGEVQVILPTRKNDIMRQREFKRYLLLLYIYKEYEMLKLVIKDNKVNQRNTMFNASYYFFQEENNDTDNSDTTNNNDISNNTNSKEEEDNKANNGYKNYIFGFNKKEKRKNIIIINNDDNNKEKNKFKETKRVKFLKKLMKYYLREDEIAYYERTKDINVKEVDDGLKITTIDYINRIADYTSNSFNFHINSDENKDSNLFLNDELKDNYFIYEYKKLTELQTGDIFGDLALTGNNIKRTATIISNDECHFACLTRELYTDFIEKGNEKIRKIKIDYLCNINILKSFSRFVLEKKLINHFIFKNFIKDKYILKSNEVNNNIIFLKEGIFEVSYIGKLTDLSNLIKLFYIEYNNLANKKEREELDKNITNSLILIIYQKSKIDFIFKKYIKEEFYDILFLVNAPSIFGFREIEKKILKINENKTDEKINLYHSNFNVKCHSNKGEYIYIDKNIFYKYIYGTNSLVQEETKLYILYFLKKIMKRLLNIIYIKLWNFFSSIEIFKNSILKMTSKKTLKTEDLYNIINKLLSITKESHFYSDEISKNLFNYFEVKRRKTQNKKHSIKVINQTYQSEKFKKIIFSKPKNNKEKNKRFSINTINTYKYINSKNSCNIINIGTNNRNKKEDKKMSSNRDIKMFKQKMDETFVNKSSKDLNSKDIKIKSRNIVNLSSLGINAYVNRSCETLFKSKINKNIKKRNRNLLSRKIASASISCRSTSYLNRNSIINNFHTSRLNSAKYNNEVNLSSIYSSRNSLSISKGRNYYNYFDILKKSKEKYIKERNRYILKSTRIFFTKTKNFDKIVRLKRVNSAL